MDGKEPFRRRVLRLRSHWTAALYGRTEPRNYKHGPPPCFETRSFEKKTKKNTPQFQRDASVRLDVFSSLCRRVFFTILNAFLPRPAMLGYRNVYPQRRPATIKYSTWFTDVFFPFTAKNPRKTYIDLFTRSGPSTVDWVFDKFRENSPLLNATCATWSFRIYAEPDLRIWGP